MRLTKHEAEEYMCCAEDVIYTLENYAYLKDIRAGKIRWVPYDWQVELLLLLLDNKNPIILKSRQGGASWRIAF